MCLEIRQTNYEAANLNSKALLSERIIPLVISTITVTITNTFNNILLLWFAFFNNMLLLRFGLLILSFAQRDLSFVE